MLNYSAIIRTIINQYKRRKKYIFSFLLLSIIVVSAITSMLTKPAISMTNELFDQFIHLQNVKSTDITDDSSDVIPTIDNNYTDSIFRNYMSQTSTILGEATRFHLFAFSDIAINSRCDGNFATPEVTLYSDFGTKQIASVGGDEVSIITNKINGNITSFDSVLLIPESYQVTMPDGSQPMQNKFSQVRINNEIANFPNGKTSLYHIKSDFIDFDVEKSRYITLSKNISDYESKGNVTLDSSDINCSTITVSNESDNENNVLNLTASQLTALQGVLKIMTNGENPLIINVDLSGCNGLYEQNFQTIVVLNGNTLTNDEANVQYGTNVLWNYYDSSSADNSYTGKIKFQNKSVFGCILSPSASIETNQSVDGNMIADSISIGYESHKMMFMTDYDIQNGEPINFADQIGPSQLLGVVRESTNINITVQINWSDGNQNHSNVSEYITVQLYKAPKNTDVNNLQPSQEINGGTVQININNNWSTFWNDKPISDTEAYYVKPVNLPSGCTVTYQNNGISQSGTIIINATKSSTTNINITAQINWSDGNQNHSNGSDSITVQLYKAPKNTDINNLQSSQQVSDGLITISSNINWQNTWSNRPVGDTEAYYVKCTSLPTGCTVTYQNNGISQSGTIILNATKSSTTNINVTAQINWSDGNQNHSNGSDSITVQLYKAPKNTDINNLQSSQQVSDGSIQISSNINWQNTWSNRPVGDTEAYYVKCTSLPTGCTVTYQNNGISQSGTIIINATKSSTTNINITAQINWSDGNQNHSNGSDSITVQLYKAPKNTDINNLQSSQQVSDGSIQISSNINWQNTWSNRPVGDTEAYYVKCTSLPTGCTVTYQNNGISQSGTIIINATKSSTTNINVTAQINWSDGNQNHSNGSDSITVQLYKAPKNTDINNLQSSQQVSDGSIQISSNINWQNTWSNRPVGDTEAYYVKCTSLPTGCTVTYQNNGISQSGTIIINATKTTSSDKVSITVNKQWVGCESIPNNAIFKLYRSHTLSTESIPGDAKTDANTVRWYESLNNNNQNNWIVIISDLPAFDNGVSWYYYVEEFRVDDVESKLNDYNISYSAYGMCNAENTVTITNTKKSEDSFSLEVQKKWEGATNYDKDVTVKLQRSTDNSSWIDIQNCTLNLSNGWYNKFTSIPKKDSQNVPYYYRVREVNVPSGYSDTYSVQSVNASTVNGSVRIEITNTLKKSSLKIKKLWENIAPQALLKDVNDIKVSVYRRAVDSQSMMSLNMSSLDKLRTFDGVLNGNVLTLGARTFSPKQYASHPYDEICYNLGAYAGSTITKVEVTFSTDSGLNGCVLGGKIEAYGMEQQSTIPLGALYSDYTTHNGKVFTFDENDSSIAFNQWTVYSNSALIITHIPDATPSYSVESVKITFGTMSYNPDVTTTPTTTTTPAVTTTITSTTTAPFTTTITSATTSSFTTTITSTTTAPFTTTITSTTTAPFTTTTTTTTTALLLQPNNRAIPAECELYTVVTLNSSDDWQKTLDNLPLGDGKGNIYEYYIVETMINLKDGSTHNYMIKSYSQDYGLQLSENADINLLSVTNVPYNTLVTMPSTGGMTTDIYYKTGLLMIITSGGIYISLAIQKKRKTSQD